MPVFANQVDTEVLPAGEAALVDNRTPEYFANLKGRMFHVTFTGITSTGVFASAAGFSRDGSLSAAADGCSGDAVGG